MYIGPQIPNNVRENAADRRDNEEEFRNCMICGYTPPSKEMAYQHRRKCAVCREGALFVGDFIKCPFCDYASSIIAKHLLKIHNIDNKLIDELNIKTVSNNYIEKMRRSVSLSIKNSDKERTRRSKLMAELNKRKDFRERASKTAIRVSSKKDIIEKRSLVLKKWREEHPDDFYEKCVKQMHKYKSKPEKDLFLFLKTKYPKLKFSNNKQIKDTIFQTNKTKRKQVDIISENKDVIVEFDGIYHFKDVRKDCAFENTKIKDKELEQYALRENIILIRVGLSQYSYRGGGGFNQEALDRIVKILENTIPGVFKLGGEYGEDNFL